MASDNRIRRSWPWMVPLAVVLIGVAAAAVWSLWPEEKPPEETTLPTTVFDYGSPEDIRCTEFSRFTGQFVEDGKDELVKNVASMLVTNQSDQYLDIATITYEIDGKEATFVATGLLPGTSAWVMEQSRMAIGNDAQYTFKDCQTAFRDVPQFDSEISLSADGNYLTATNNTAGTLKDVYVYYKSVHTDGNYLGGITYRVSFGDLPSGASLETLAGHYDDTAQVVRVTWQE